MLYDQLIQSFSSDNAQRVQAMEVFKNQGFPTVKEEDWKYTNIKDIVNQTYNLQVSSDVSAIDANAYRIPNLDCELLVFVNGVFSSELSDFQLVEVKPLSQAWAENTAEVQQYWDTLTEKKESFALLNTALATEGVFVHIPKAKAMLKPIYTVYLTTEQQFLQVRNLIIIEPRAEVSLIEQHLSTNSQAILTNAVTEIVVGEEAHLKYYKIQNDSKDSSLIDNTFIVQKAKSNATVFTFSFEGKIIRNNLNFYHEGEYLQANMFGVAFIKGSTLVDNHTFIDHKVLNCESNEWYKSIYDESARGVFNGKVLVDPEAQKTNAYQQNDNVLLSEKASIDTKPQLEIFADDVKCSHGCTVGQLDETGLFYLRQRGIPEKEARALLLFAYTSAILEKVENKPIKEYINKIIANRLEVDLDF